MGFGFSQRFSHKWAVTKPAELLSFVYGEQ